MSESVAQPVCPETSGVALLDAAVVSQLRTLDPDGALLLELIGEFRSDAERLMPRLSNGARDLEHKPVCEAAHSLKGAAATLGMVGLSTLYGELEQLGEARRFELMAPKLAQLKVGVEQALQALDSARRGAL